MRTKFWILEMFVQIGFLKQGGHSSCGLHSISNALQLVGIPASIMELGRKVKSIEKTDKDGINEKNIIRGIETFGGSAKAHTLDSQEKTKLVIDKALDQGKSIVICVWDYNHWAVLAGKTPRGKYIWIDSGEEEVMGIAPWSEISDWMIARNEEEETEEYFFITVGNSRVQSVVPTFYDRYLAIKRNILLREYWGSYLQDLHEFFGNSRKQPSISGKIFFEKYSETIADAVYYYSDFGVMASINSILDNYKFIAESYGLTVPEKNVHAAIAQLSVRITKFMYDGTRRLF